MKSDKSKYIVLLSGGLDSAVNLYAAHAEGTVVKALTFDYGQRCAKQEVGAASYFSSKLGIGHEVVALPWLGKITSTALVNRDREVPHLKNLDDLGETRKTAKAVWVPNRNGVFLNIAAAFAESLDVEFVIPGFNSEEAATFPDNSPAFIEAATHAFSLSTLSKVKVACFTSGIDKTAIVQKAEEYHVELNRLWSCYEGGDKPCGQCESCLRTDRALQAVRGRRS